MRRGKTFREWIANPAVNPLEDKDAIQPNIIIYRALVLNVGLEDRW